MSPILPPCSYSAVVVLDNHAASLGLSFWKFCPMIRLPELRSDCLDRSAMRMTRQFLL